MNDPDHIDNPVQDIVEHKIRRAVGLNALHKMGGIVAAEQQADAEKAKIVRWFIRYGWLVALVAGLSCAYVFGII